MSDIKKISKGGRSKEYLQDAKMRAMECYIRGNGHSSKETLEYVGCNRTTIKRWYELWDKNPHLVKRLAVNKIVNNHLAEATGIAMEDLQPIVLQLIAEEILTYKMELSKARDMLEYSELEPDELSRLINAIKLDMKALAGKS